MFIEALDAFLEPQGEAKRSADPPHRPGDEEAHHEEGSQAQGDFRSHLGDCLSSSGVRPPGASWLLSPVSDDSPPPGPSTGGWFESSSERSFSVKFTSAEEARIARAALRGPRDLVYLEPHAGRPVERHTPPIGDGVDEEEPPPRGVAEVGRLRHGYEA